MNEQTLTSVKENVAQVEGLTAQFVSRTNVLLDEISVLTQALDNLTLNRDRCGETSRSSALTVAQLSTLILQQV
ncbi:hypothetical protein [Oscillatoria sp. FACHB-1406]|uniref:hypothetical protein n=1 Tax=Oscillatoria sp. FACHB-1406 TaxID=2692846 RepID=UPI001686FDDA|nr:hypothetical protein [Oscillatoria sp. FACHB-1406]MBD2578308.1 hypothetical protein [Oscillatoria sp. FACHB-1406]